MSPEEMPAVPEDRLDAGGWERVEETTETVFQLPTAKVEGHTLLFEDGNLRERVIEAGGDDRTWRFFFATTLSFHPPLAPGVSTMVKPTVVTEARDRFADDLRKRGFENIDRGRTQTIRAESDARIRLSQYRARLVVSETRLTISGFLGVWYDDDFYIAGGAYPESGLETWVDTDPEGYRDELLELIRAVG
ncbi:MAG: hypothetical protein PPP58_07315 [Natronomonas sp.]